MLGPPRRSARGRRHENLRGGSWRDVFSFVAGGSLSGTIEASYEVADDLAAAQRGSDVLIDPEAADPAEVLPEEGIDLGELVVQGDGLPVQQRPDGRVPIRRLRDPAHLLLQLLLDHRPVQPRGDRDEPA